jgi:hypothetical protein
VRKETVPNGNGGWTQVTRDIYEATASGISACSGECDCLHLSETTYAQNEAKRVREARKSQREADNEALRNSLLAVR